MKLKKYSKKIVAWIIILNAVFALGVLFIFYRIGNEPSTLITAWFSFTTIELWSLAGIKKREIKKDELSEIFKIENEDLRGE